MEKKVKDVKKGKDDSKETFDLSDIEKNSQDGFLLGVMGSMPETSSFETDLCNIGFDGNAPTVKETTASLEAVSLDKLDSNVTDAAPIEKDTEAASCIVCDKKFKSKSCMNKHLRSVHAGWLIEESI